MPAAIAGTKNRVNRKKHYGAEVRRCEYPREHVAYWRVHVQLFKETLTAHFHDGDFADKTAARAAAQELADEINAGIAAAGIRWRRDPRSLLGTKRLKALNWLPTGVSVAGKQFIARWTDAEGRSRKKTFSIEVHTHQGAYRLACAARTKGEAEVRKAVTEAENHVHRLFKSLVKKYGRKLRHRKETKDRNNNP